MRRIVQAVLAVASRAVDPRSEALAVKLEALRVLAIALLPLVLHGLEAARVTSAADTHHQSLSSQCGRTERLHAAPGHLPDVENGEGVAISA